MLKNHTRDGFTLVEIMVVVAILALLSAIVIPNLLRARINSNETSAKGALKTISTALENYYIINDSYPNNTSLLLGAAPPYLTKDYFVGTHAGYTFDATALAVASYLITGTPTNTSQGSSTFTISTGAVASW